MLTNNAQLCDATTCLQGIVQITETFYEQKHFHDTHTHAHTHEQHTHTHTQAKYAQTHTHTHTQTHARTHTPRVRNLETLEGSCTHYSVLYRYNIGLMLFVVCLVHVFYGVYIILPSPINIAAVTESRPLAAPLEEKAGTYR